MRGACVEIKILRRVRAESSRRPPRHRRDACSPDALVDFHTERCNFSRSKRMPLCASTYLAAMTRRAIFGSLGTPPAAMVATSSAGFSAPRSAPAWKLRQISQLFAALVAVQMTSKSRGVKNSNASGDTRLR